jgi:hypothetical protein
MEKLTVRLPLVAGGRYVALVVEPIYTADVDHDAGNHKHIKLRGPSTNHERASETHQTYPSR